MIVLKISIWVYSGTNSIFSGAFTPDTKSCSHIYNRRRFIDWNSIIPVDFILKLKFTHTCETKHIISFSYEVWFYSVGWLFPLHIRHKSCANMTCLLFVIEWRLGIQSVGFSIYDNILISCGNLFNNHNFLYFWNTIHSVM